MTILLFMALVISSFDTFLAFEFGFTVRLAIVLLAPMAAIGLLQALIAPAHPLLWPVLIVACIHLLFVLNAISFVRGIAYALQFFFYVGLLFWASNHFKKPEQATLLYGMYALSFVIFAVWMLIHYGLEYDELRPDRRFGWPRAFFFSFEPSYLATYISVFLGLFTVLTLITRSNLRRFFYAFSALLSAATLLIAASRMGLLVIPIAAALPAVLLLLFIKNRRYRCQLGLATGATMLLAVALVSLTAGKIDYQAKFEQAFAGVFVNISGTRTVRINGALDTLEVALQNPVLGHGYGDIPYQIAAINGKELTNLAEVESQQGFNITAEGLAALGIPTFSLFLFFIARLLIRPALNAWHAASSLNTHQMWALALAVGLVFQLFLLQFNQNIFRIYVWLHIMVLVVAIQHSQSLQKLYIPNFIRQWTKS